MGGSSDEREVSLASGAQVTHALRECGHEVVAVDTVSGPLSSEDERALFRRGVAREAPGSPRLARLSSARVAALTGEPPLVDVDVFFVALHGGAGEDGTVQGLLDLTGVRYTGSDRLGCSLAMDKEVTKRLLRDAGVPTPDWLVGPHTATAVADALGLPVIVKAATGGSSLRLALAHDMDELQAVIGESRRWEDVVIFERYHPGRELTVGVLGREALPVGEIVPKREYFDYECKYQPGMADEIFPARVSPDVAELVQKLALRAFRCLRLRDYARVDFMVDRSGAPWCLEANAAPGMTANSLLPKAAKAAGMEFSELCERITRLAESRR